MQKLWNYTKQTAKKIAEFQAHLILILLYFVIIAPFALVIRWRADPLSLKKRTLRGWQLKAETKDDPMKRAGHQS